ncbi:MAG: glutamine--tRNA ligase [Gammaproteobacteria bacterium]|jgi:glutaminyl-tRNA synthetase|nr:glutamine--tRNA ligase [Gammaproteobacteria bacterium]HJN95089.1 glutamine--tRNA ligase/YqeY domain fusion protein [Gammaproteobacteria bacterium]|tara:strand:- start:2742 stop:4484 length:1743 start_codon:yes stop_codon:yes gene_type:complete
MTDSDSDSKDPSAGSAASNFIRNMIAQDLASQKHGGRVHTRFPPEPNGYLHIGHAKSICLNFGVAKENGGHCNLRFDDTNPAKESQEFVDAIKDNIAWLGFNWHGEVRYSSSYFDYLYDFAVQLIEKSQAFVCSLSPEESREHRGSLTEPGRNSPDRDRSVAENLQLFARMRGGEFAEGEYSLRAKIDMGSPNINMRDPVLYRIRHIDHHQTGDKWCIYPTYDYTHCISDAIENITHSLCTLEFEDHRPLYDWILHKLDSGSLRSVSDLSDSNFDYVLPEQTEFAKLKLNFTMMGKRNLKEMVESGVVNGWDDPRMPTLAGMRRRGFTPASIKNFCESVGVSRSESVVDMSMLEHAIREDLDSSAPRAMCVLNPLKLVLSNVDEGQAEHLELARHPKDESMGRRTVPFSRELLIDRSDFEAEPPPGFKRLIPGGEVRLRGAYIIRCDEVVEDSKGVVQQLNCTIDKDTLGKRPQGRKVKGVIHWVSAAHGVKAKLRLYDRLFNVQIPEGKDVQDYRQVLNPDSLIELNECMVEPSAVAEGASPNYQFEREGYFRLDAIDSTDELPVFNRTITLRDSWSSK